MLPFLKKSIKNTVAIAGIATGIAITGISAYWAVIDLTMLYNANLQVQNKAQSAKKSEADYLYSRELAHRINVFADGTWMFMGIIIGLQSISLLYYEAKQ